MENLTNEEIQELCVKMIKVLDEDYLIECINDNNPGPEETLEKVIINFLKEKEDKILIEMHKERMGE